MCDPTHAAGDVDFEEARTVVGEPNQQGLLDPPAGIWIATLPDDGSVNPEIEATQPDAPPAPPTEPPADEGAPLSPAPQQMICALAP
jgi:hypothetical protein